MCCVFFGKHPQDLVGRAGQLSNTVTYFSQKNLKFQNHMAHFEATCFVVGAISLLMLRMATLIRVHVVADVLFV